MPTDLTGTWRTGSGAEYQFRPESDYIIALYWDPSPAQQAAGFKRGDLAYRGTLIGKILVGTFFQRFSLENKDRCPGLWERPTTLYLQLSDDGNSLSGALLEEHLSDESCVIDDRRLGMLNFQRSAGAKEAIGAVAKSPAEIDRQDTTSGG
jgi:hypothetical protein